MTEPATGLLEAMLAVQGSVPTLKKSENNPAFRGAKYTPLDAIVETVGPLLQAHGLVWSTKPSYIDGVGPSLKYMLAHAPTKEREEGEMLLLLPKNDPQGQGSAITYARRYALCAVLNLVADDDDDGNGASGGAASVGGGNASKAQKAAVRRLFTQNGVTKGEAKRLLAEAGVTVGEDEDPRDAVDRLRWPGVSELIDFLKQGVVTVGGSDVPADADAFTHEPEPDDATTGIGPA